MDQRWSCRLRVALALVAVLAAAAPGAEMMLKNGMRLEGRLGKLSSLHENPLKATTDAGEVDVRLIVLVDDGLRRTFVSTYQVQNIQESDPHGLERILIDQRIARRGKYITSIGAIIAIDPFDQWGRRVFAMKTPDGRLDVLQGITEITPVWTRVRGVLCQQPVVCDMRIATSSVPRQTLSKILMQQLDADDPDQRLKIVRLYLQAERYRDAQAELEAAIAQFPDLAELNQQLVQLRQMSARTMIKEIQLRQKAGQYLLAYNLLSSFPEENVAGETLQQVRELLDEYQQAFDRRDRVLELINAHLADLEDADRREQLQGACDEIKAEANINTLGRMTDYLRLADDENLAAEQKLALAVSGWLLGPGSGTENLAVAASLHEVRNLVREYLASDQPQRRAGILQQLGSLEGSSPEYVAKLLAHMKPPIETPPAEGATPLLFELSTPGLAGEPDFRYLVQLPPEYDPYRRYPAVVTLNGAGTTPQLQIDWWAGVYKDAVKMRLGQATRRGYITIAPLWSQKYQTEYHYNLQEHAAVLYSLRDACRRFSVDTDRVYLSGHSMGGNAAWDIGLAHPDLWAGVIPIVAQSGKYVAHYSENAKNVPLYFVGGELDGTKSEENSRDIDRYFKRAGYDAMVVQYQGRGHEDFSDEVQRIFEWMELHQRNFFPEQFKAVAMRTWDNYFYWAELDQYPERSMVLPFAWPPPPATRPTATEGSIYEGNRVSLRTGAALATVWLSPEMVDFQQRVEIAINGRRQNAAVNPDLEVLLEDARTRADRIHPFWAKLEVRTGRGGR